MTTTTLRSLCALALAGAACFSCESSAAVISGTVTGGTSGGVFELLTSPPAEAGPNTFESPNLIAFDEQQRVVLDAPLMVRPDLVLPVGSIVWSHYVAFDPNVGSTVEGFVDFDRRIVGIIDTAAALDATSLLLGADDTTYSTANASGLESGGFRLGTSLPQHSAPVELQCRRAFAGRSCPRTHGHCARACHLGIAAARYWRAGTGRVSPSGIEPNYTPRGWPRIVAELRPRET